MRTAVRGLSRYAFPVSGRKARTVAGVEPPLPLAAPREQLLAALAEVSREPGHEVESVPGQDRLVGALERAPDHEPAHGARAEGHGMVLLGMGLPHHGIA
jgi:hypothetical protein